MRDFGLHQAPAQPSPHGRRRLAGIMPEILDARDHRLLLLGLGRLSGKMPRTTSAAHTTTSTDPALRTRLIMVTCAVFLAPASWFQERSSRSRNVFQRISFYRAGSAIANGFSLDSHRNR